MTSRFTFTFRGNTLAVGLILGHVLLVSFFPVLVALAGTEGPFLFAAMYGIGVVIGLVPFLLIRYRRLIANRHVWHLAWQRTLSWAMLFWILSEFDIAFFSWSAGFVDVSLSAILYQLSPVMMIILTGRLFSSEERYRKIGAYTLLSFVFAVIGVAAVVASQSGGFATLVDHGEISPLTLGAGVGLALAAAGLVVLAAYGFRWGSDLATSLPNEHGYTRTALEVFGVVIGLVICNLLASPGIALIGLARDEPVNTVTLGYALIGGGLLGAFPAILWRTGNLVTNNLGINVLSYFTPLLALGWLFALSLVGDVEFMLLFFGAVVIVVANIGVFVDSRQSSESMTRGAVEGRNINDLIDTGESDTLEFKSTLRLDLRTGERERRIELAILKSLAAFLNTNGGTLVIGVSDNHAPVGIHVDEFPDEDKMSLHLRNIVNRRMEPAAMSLIHPSFHDFEGVRVMVLRCDPSKQPVFVDEGSNTESFYIRTGPSTTPLSISEANGYIRDRF